MSIQDEARLLLGASRRMDCLEYLGTSSDVARSRHQEPTTSQHAKSQPATLSLAELLFGLREADRWRLDAQRSRLWRLTDTKRNTVENHDINHCIHEHVDDLEQCIFYKNVLRVKLMALDRVRELAAALRKNKLDFSRNLSCY